MPRKNPPPPKTTQKRRGREIEITPENIQLTHEEGVNGERVSLRQKMTTNTFQSTVNITTRRKDVLPVWSGKQSGRPKKQPVVLAAIIDDEEDDDGHLGAVNDFDPCLEGPSRPTTAMTVHMDDEDDLPFYMANLTLGSDSSPFDQLLHVVGQTEPKKWTQFPRGTFTATNVKKLGEGAYGEVYATVMKGRRVAIKIVPIEADEAKPLFNGQYNGGKMPSCALVLPEVVVLKELSKLNNPTSNNSTPNFITVVDCYMVRGKYPTGLTKAWDMYADMKESLNDRPAGYSTDKQLYIAFVTANGGSDLESFIVSTENEVRSILCQLMLSLIVAENELEFEHRDLHLGNVLIEKVEKTDKLEYKLNANPISINSFGIKTNIIDFTLSRIKKDGTTVFFNLENDEEIFEGQNDLQFDVYRRMRFNNNRNWQDFHPTTNLYWIEYLANKLIEEPICPKNLLTPKRRKELKTIFKQLGRFRRCSETLQDANFYDKFYAGIIEK
ncbi:unnamed protein product [Caenorhabditis angaria]|uniref:non-specific serine/threonine protein kinase n=1 Tax=Caenorhabditis angaria TaxID=860376 RepID=A0A9P1IQ84_9PELO|nr:unnamed protein product [Caenorhabditis angaria]